MTVPNMERLESLEKWTSRGARAAFALLIVALVALAFAYVSSDGRARIRALAARFDETALRSIAADPADGAAFDHSIDRICGRRRANECEMLDRAGVLARWSTIRRDTALPNAFEIEIDHLSKGAKP